MLMYTKKKAAMSKEYDENQMKLMGAAAKDPSLKLEHDKFKEEKFKECDLDGDNKHNEEEFKKYNQEMEKKQVDQLGSAITFTDEEYKELFKMYSKIFATGLGLTKAHYDQIPILFVNYSSR